MRNNGEHKRTAQSIVATAAATLLAVRLVLGDRADTSDTQAMLAILLVAYAVALAVDCGGAKKQQGAGAAEARDRGEQANIEANKPLVAGHAGAASGSESATAGAAAPAGAAGEVANKAASCGGTSTADTANEVAGANREQDEAGQGEAPPATGETQVQNPALGPGSEPSPAHEQQPAPARAQQPSPTPATEPEPQPATENGDDADAAGQPDERRLEDMDIEELFALAYAEDERQRAAEAAEGAEHTDDKPSPVDETEALLLRSTDVIGTLADMAAHAEEPEELLLLIERAELYDWTDTPRVQARMLARNGHWWLYSDERLDNDAYDRMMATELLLNLADDLRYRRRDTETPLDEKIREVLRSTDSLMPLLVPGNKTSFYAQGAREGGEWAARLSLADFAETLPTPLRVSITMQVNVDDGIIVVDAEVPRPAAFEAVAASSEERAAACRDYAMRLCLALGRGAFGAAAGISRVVVNGHENGTQTPVMSLDLTRPGLDRLRTEMASAAMGELPRGLGIRWFTSADGRLAPVDPFLAVWDDAVAPLSRWSGLEEMRQEAPRAVRSSCKARTVSDLGINEKAVRIGAWNEATGWLGSTTRRAVAAFEARRRAASDATVAEACERVSRALVTGELDVFDRRSMAYLFVEGGKLASTVRDVSQLINARPTHTPEEVEQILARLEAELSEPAQTARYEDDTRNIFRYFNSVAERVRYNLGVADDGRELRLVPDEYYAAHSQAAQMLVALQRPVQALAHADELVRVGPYTTDAALTRVRCLEELTRIYEAVEQLKLAIERASTVQDMSVCLYRLAFMEWKLGHGKVSVACYQRAAELHGGIRDRALSELDDVIAADHTLRRLSDEEARRAIEEAGLPYGDADGLRKTMRDAAVACTDAGLLAAARPLAGVLLEAEQDDVLLDVYASLVPTRPE